MIITDKSYRSAHVGAKAHNLFIMRENGFNVPPFFCVFGENSEEAEKYAHAFLMTPAVFPFDPPLPPRTEKTFPLRDSSARN